MPGKVNLTRWASALVALPNFFCTAAHRMPWPAFSVLLLLIRLPQYWHLVALGVALVGVALVGVALVGVALVGVALVGVAGGLAIVLPTFRVTCFVCFGCAITPL